MPSSSSSSYNTADVIAHYQRKMDRHKDDTSVLLNALTKLGRVHGVSIAILQETGIGRAVNSLKKHQDEQVATSAKDLVAKWKEIVANEEEEEEEEEEKKEEPVQEDEEVEEPQDPVPDLSEPEEEEPPRKKEKKSSSHKSSSSSSKSSRHSRKEDEDEDERERRKRKEKEKKKKRDKERDEKRSSKSSSHKDKQKEKHSKSSSKSSSSSRHKESDAFSQALSNGNNGHDQPSSSALPEGISPNYRPLPRKKEESDSVNRRPVSSQDQDEALSALIKGKGSKRTAVYSGAKRTGFFGEIPSLFNMCIHILQEHVDSIEECGGLSFDVLEPVLARATPTDLERIEEYNPHLMEDTGGLWEKFCKKNFPKGKREEMESYREMFERCTQEREEKFNFLRHKVKQTVDREKSGMKKTKLAYVGLNAKPPRNVRTAQARNGTALPTGHPLKRAGLAPRPPRESSGASGASASSPINRKPKVAPMMAKTLKMVRGMKSGFRR